MFELETGEVVGIVAVVGEGAGPVEVHCDAAFADEAAGDGEGGSVFFEMGDGGFEVFEAVVEFG